MNTKTRNTTFQPPRAAQDAKVPPRVDLLSELIWIVKTIRTNCKDMVKYQLRLSTRNRDGRWDHRYTGLYATVAEIFAKPEFAAYVQKNMLGEYHTIKVFTVNVADENV